MKIPDDLKPDIPTIGVDKVYIPQMIVPYPNLMLWLQSLNGSVSLKKIVGFIPVFNDHMEAMKFGVHVDSRSLVGAREVKLDDKFKDKKVRIDFPATLKDLEKQ